MFTFRSASTTHELIRKFSFQLLWRVTSKSNFLQADNVYFFWRKIFTKQDINIKTVYIMFFLRKTFLWNLSLRSWILSLKSSWFTCYARIKKCACETRAFICAKMVLEFINGKINWKAYLQWIFKFFYFLLITKETNLSISDFMIEYLGNLCSKYHGKNRRFLKQLYTFGYFQGVINRSSTFKAIFKAIFSFFAISWVFIFKTILILKRIIDSKLQF